MSSAKSGSDILAARDGRQKLLDRQLAAAYPATITLSLNIPGPGKTPPGARELFDWTMERLRRIFPGIVPRIREVDDLGPWALLTLDGNPGNIKQCCVELETEQPAARLIDLDVYDHRGIQLDRRSLHLEPRPCLLCRNPAMECMRLQRHSPDQVIARAHFLLSSVRLFSDPQSPRRH